MDTLINIVIFGLACGYLTYCLLLETAGPFPIQNTFVQDFGVLRQAALFDRIRKFIGVYTIKQEPDIVIYNPNNRASVFRCPICLSFWVAIPFSIFFYLQFQSDLNIIVYHFAIATLSSFVAKEL